MYVVNGVLKWTNRLLTVLGLISALAMLYLWYQAFIWWGDPMAMASAMTWSVVTVVLIGASALIERVQNRGG